MPSAAVPLRYMFYYTDVVRVEKTGKDKRPCRTVRFQLAPLGVLGTVLGCWLRDSGSMLTNPSRFLMFFFQRTLHFWFQRTLHFYFTNMHLFSFAYLIIYIIYRNGLGIVRLDCFRSTHFQNCTQMG